MTAARQCGTCTLCCKVMGIRELEKPPGAWCPHCTAGRGCNIYSDRPPSCAAFACAWLRDEKWGPEWKPEKAKFVLTANDAARWLSIHVDPAMPEAWKRAPYYERIQKLMRAALPKGGRVFIVTRDRHALLLPDGEHQIGTLQEGDVVTVMKNLHGEEYRIKKSRQ